MSNVTIKKSFKGPERPGTYYRLLCLTGENKGFSYYLQGKRLVMGRGKEVDISVPDTKSSKIHAEICRVGDDYVLTDLGSLNGVFVNERRVIQGHLRNGDRLIIGKTVFRFDVINVKGDLKSFLGIEEKKKSEETKEEIEPEGPKKKPLNKKLILGLIVLGALFLFDTEKPAVKKREKKIKKDESAVERDFQSLLKKGSPSADKEVRDKLAGAIHRGLRELREKNYFRAIQEFNMALILHPNHARASFYLKKAKKDLDDEISQIFLRGRRDADSLKYEGAIVSFCQVINLLEGYETDERFLEAKEQIEFFEEKLGLEKGATKCAERK